jgi:hypothetical protein
MEEKITWILEGVLLLSEGLKEEQLIEYGIPRAYLNQIRAVYNIIK